MENLDIDKMEVYLTNFIPESRKQSGIFLCMSGSADILVNGQRFHIGRGVLCIISPLVNTYTISQSDDFNGVHISDELKIFYAVIHSIVDVILRLKIRNNPCIQLEEEDIQYIVRQKQRIDSKYKLLEETADEEVKTVIRQLIQLLEQEVMLEVIYVYCRNQTVEPHPVEKQETVVYNFIYSLHHNFKKERSVTFYANEAQLSTGHFTSVVKQKTGQTPSEWIIAITIINAKLLLEKSHKSIKEIAMELNFPEQFTFRKYFKQYVGVPPKQYRTQILKDMEKQDS